MRWQFRVKAPLPFVVLFSVFMCNLVIQLATAFAISRWAPQQPDATHSYPIHWRGGIVTFVQPWLGKYCEYGFWAHFIMLALLLPVCWWYRDQMERIS
jgi:hypothetical protein